MKSELNVVYRNIAKTVYIRLRDQTEHDTKNDREQAWISPLKDEYVGSRSSSEKYTDSLSDPRRLNIVSPFFSILLVPGVDTVGSDMDEDAACCHSADSKHSLPMTPEYISCYCTREEVLSATLLFILQAYVA